MWAKIFRGLILKIYYPILMFITAFYKRKRESWQGHIIRLNNKFVLIQGIKTKRILLLLPHCIQVDTCKIRITHDINNCKRCGKCEIKDLIGISESKSLNLYVASGGTIARKIASEVKPELIIAVACERDLSSGLADSYPMPVYGIPNQRPFGPCFNTRVDIDLVTQAISLFCE
ncbi:MAG: DUF116 domain-containing protein [Nitrospirae bacterium]|nr:DUF116 domain-containing protein [Nitrospirota bacterium]